jgi:hypothetical protein
MVQVSFYSRLETEKVATVNAQPAASVFVTSEVVGEAAGRAMKLEDLRSDHVRLRWHQHRNSATTSASRRNSALRSAISPPQTTSLSDAGQQEISPRSPGKA